MSYVERVLQPGEQVRHISSIHWIVYWPGVAVALLALAAFWFSEKRLLTGVLAVYGIRARSRCGRSSGPGMVPVVDH